MNAAAFAKAYGASRNGTDFYTEHALTRRFIYSDGVAECADAGIAWLVDIAATECARRVFKAARRALLEVTASNGGALLALSFGDDSVAWSRRIEATDLPPGRYVFLLDWDGYYISMCLLSEY